MLENGVDMARFNEAMSSFAVAAGGRRPGRGCAAMACAACLRWWSMAVIAVGPGSPAIRRSLKLSTTWSI